MIHQIIFSGHVSPDISKTVERNSVERMYNYCEQSGITGLKLYTDGSFFFISEGSHSALQALKQAYQQDGRLSDIVVLLENERDEPEFQDFRMAFCKSDTRANLPYCFILNAENLKQMLPESISNNARILAKTFARVNNLIAC